MLYAYKGRLAKRGGRDKSSLRIDCITFWQEDDLSVLIVNRLRQRIGHDVK